MTRRGGTSQGVARRGAGAVPAALRAAALVALAAVLLVAALLGGLRAAAALRETEVRPPPEGRMVATDLGAVHVEEAGPTGGRPVLLIHGSVGWARLWAPAQEALARSGYRTIAVDLAPMGWSDRDPEGDYGRVRQALRIRALVRAMGIRPVIVAHSFGAGPAAEAVMADPGAVAGLVVVSGAIALDARPAPLPLPLRSQWAREVAVAATVANPLAMRRLLRLFLHRKDTATPGVVAMLNAPFRREGTTRAVAQWLPSLLSAPRDARSTRPEAWRALRVPLAFVWGAEDATTPLAQGRRLAALTGAGLTVLPGIGHIPQIEDPAAFHAALIAALARIGG